MPSIKHEVGVYIGRFQPPHNAHLAVMQEAFTKVAKLIICLGSARSARTVKNPFTAQERREMILSMLREAEAGREVVFLEVQDYFDDEEKWLQEVIGGVKNLAGSRDIVLVGHIKDDTSYYLKSFPEWQFLPTSVVSSLSATDVRRAYFEERYSDLSVMVPSAVSDFLTRFRSTGEYQTLQGEYLDNL